MNNNPSGATRPGYYPDLKWICGLLAAFGLGLTLLLSTLSVLTSQAVLVPIASGVVTNLLTQNNQGSNQDATALITALKKQPGDTVYPIPGQPVSLSKQELDSIKPAELMPLAIERLATSYYELGVDGVIAQQQLTGEQRAAVEGQAGLLKYLNKNTHDKIASVARVAAWVTLLPFIGLIFFSYSLGRLVSPGVVLLLVALPGTILTGLAYATKVGDSGGSGPIPYLSPAATQQLAQAVFPVFATTCLASLVLLVIALVWRMIRALRSGG